MATDVERIISRAQLSAVTSFDEAMEMAASTFGGVIDASEVFGDGFVLANKDDLIGIPFVILNYTFHKGDFGDDFVVCRAVTAADQKVVITDGSTGIREQLRSFNGQNGGIFAKRGLTKSEYVYKDDKGKDVPAATFYIA